MTDLILLQFNIICQITDTKVRGEGIVFWECSGISVFKKKIREETCNFEESQGEISEELFINPKKSHSSIKDIHIRQHFQVMCGIRRKR